MENKIFNELYTFHFGCKNHEIDSITLGNSLIYLSTILNEVNNVLHTGKKIEIKIKSFQPGSFEVPFELIETVIAGVLCNVNTSYISSIINILKEFIEVKIKLKGEEPLCIEKKEKEMILKSNTGDNFNVSLTVGNIILNNPTINDSFNKKIKIINTDKNISDFEIKNSENQSIVKISKDNFKYFIEDYNIQELLDKSENEKIKEEEASLNIYKIVFESSLKWSFIYKGNKINAIILDEKFNNKVQTGEKFACGDILKVNLKIFQEYDSFANTYKNKNYEITKVVEHIPRPKENTLF